MAPAQCGRKGDGRVWFGPISLKRWLSTKFAHPLPLVLGDPSCPAIALHLRAVPIARPRVTNDQSRLIRRRAGASAKFTASQLLRA
eukprot:5987384-Alexandrium_andersonii.AAC.1